MLFCGSGSILDSKLHLRRKRRHAHGANGHLQNLGNHSLAPQPFRYKMPAIYSLGSESTWYAARDVSVRRMWEVLLWGPQPFFSWSFAGPLCAKVMRKGITKSSKIWPVHACIQDSAFSGSCTVALNIWRSEDSSMGPLFTQWCCICKGKAWPTMSPFADLRWTSNHLGSRLHAMKNWAVDAREIMAFEPENQHISRYFILCKRKVAFCAHYSYLVAVLGPLIFPPGGLCRGTRNFLFFFFVLPGVCPL